MRILLVNNQFSIGGAARVAAVQCNQLHKLGHFQLFVVTDYKNWPIDYELNREIALLPIDLPVNQNSILKKIKKAVKCILDIRHYIKSVKPDLIIAIQADMYLRTLIANIGFGVKLIVADHTSFNRKQDFFTDFTRYTLYHFADGISILTRKDEKILGQRYMQKKVIFNPLCFECGDREYTRKHNVLCVGRLDVWDLKGFDIIIKLWPVIHSKFPEWTLEIAGSGSDTAVKYLRQIAIDEKVEDSVVFLGQVKDMQSLYQQTSIFALPSRMEGFPMALLEAMSQGCACVSFSVYGAVDEMLGEDAGIVIADGENQQFANALMSLMQDSITRNEYRSKAIDKSKDFSSDKFGLEWQSFIFDIIKK